MDINRELPGNMAVGFEYSGSTGRDLGLGGSNDGVININQVPSQYLALGPALLEQVPNPFFGLPNVVINGASFPQGKSVTSPTIQRRELLRPYPQFNDILMRQSTYGESQYHAAIFKFEKRMSNGWGGRINYTYSRLEDNQFGEDNFFAGSPGFVGAVPSEMANVDITQDDYGVDAEYGIGLLDVPHKVVFSPIAELPFGEGKKWLNDGIGNILLGDWTVSSILSFESGFPLTYNTNTNTSNIFTRVQRPNGTPQATDGSRHERIAPPQGSACTSDCGIGVWVDRLEPLDAGQLHPGHDATHRRLGAHAASQQLGLRGDQGHPLRRQPRARPAPPRGAEPHQHGEGPEP